MSRISENRAVDEHSSSPSSRYLALIGIEDGENWKEIIQKSPQLPHPRPRELSPLRFRESGIGAPYTSVQETSPYFELPPDIRVDILRLAFGDSRLHMNLSYSHPDASRRWEHHCGIDNKKLKRSRKKKERIVDSTQPKAWRWWSSICHRLPPDAPSGPMTRGGADGPWADSCRDGEAAECQKWRGCSDDPSACHIGVMGWLLSCRLK